MKFCQPHWDELRKAIDERGLTHLISSSGEEVARRITQELQSEQQKPTVATFDPLMNANFAIWTNALRMGGLYLMNPDPEGNPYCPLCELEKHTPEKAATWIGYAADEQFERAKHLGLAGSA